MSKIKDFSNKHRFNKKKTKTEKLEEKQSTSKDVDIAFYSLPYDPEIEEQTLDAARDLENLFFDNLKLQMRVYKAQDKKGNPCVRFSGHEDVVKLVELFINEIIDYDELYRRAENMQQEIQAAEKAAHDRLEAMVDKI